MNINHRIIPVLTTVFVTGASAWLAACDGAQHTKFSFDCGPKAIESAQLLDLTNSARSEELLTSRLDAIRSAAERIADCDGRLSVIAFGGSTSSFQTLFDGDLHPAGAEEVARDRRIPKLVDDTMATIRANVQTALNTIDGDGSDPIAPVVLAGDWAAAQPADSTVEVTVYSDMIGTTGELAMNEPDPDADELVAKLPTINLPDLDRVQLSMRGVGRVGAPPEPPTDYVGKVRKVATGLCEATGATCVISTTE